MPKAWRLLVLLALATPRLAAAQDVRLEITARDQAYGGGAFGTHGAYERINAVAHMRIDPRDPANKGIADLAFAPRARDGIVEYDVDVTILRPRDPAKARRVLLYDVVNRGMKPLSMLNGGSIGPGDPVAQGDGFLMRQGYTLVWSGWQGDIAGGKSRGGLIGARFPIVSRNGKPLTGAVAAERIFDSPSGDRIDLPYPAASLEQPAARLTVRARTGDEPRLLPRSAWRFVDERHVAITRPADMDAGAIYRFEYAARDPRVMGLGFAATRDLIAWLRKAPAGAGNPLADLSAAACERDAQGACVNPEGGIFSSAIAMGVSQSGRYLRDFLWQGFNRDLAGRPVFDGMIPIIAGARRTFTNFRFAEPGRFSRQHEDHDVPGFTFPYAYATIEDPVTGRTDGILRRCEASGTCPRLFHVDTSAEFWQAGASLVGTGGTGRDVAFPANVRAFMITGGPHATGIAPGMCRYPANPLNYSPILRALLVAMVDWTGARAEPPASRWPSLAKGELAPVEDLRPPLKPWATVLNRPVPPAGKREWPVLAPAIDADGNDRPGIRMPQVAAPAGTYLGWNLRKPGFGEGDLCAIFGSHLPFPATAAERGDDARPSLAERYRPGERAERLAAAARQLQQERLLLAEDAARQTAEAAAAH